MPITPFGRCERSGLLIPSPRVDQVEELLRRLALNDEKSVGMVLMSGSVPEADVALVPKVDLLVRLGALVAVGAATASLRRTVQLALAAGATEAEIVGVLVAVAPTVGLARVVATAPKLADAIGYDMASDE
jgi:4-carboxymuconolactone decarboxylase